MKWKIIEEKYSKKKKCMGKIFEVFLGLGTEFVLCKVE